MKRKICLALLALSSGLMMVFAAATATVDKCTEKFNGCVTSCGNAKASCIARAGEPAECEQRFKMCKADCDKALKDCQAKSQPKK